MELTKYPDFRDIVIIGLFNKVITDNEIIQNSGSEHDKKAKRIRNNCYILYGLKSNDEGQFSIAGYEAWLFFIRSYQTPFESVMEFTGFGGLEEKCNGKCKKLVIVEDVSSDSSKIKEEKEFNMKCVFESMKKNIKKVCSDPEKLGSIYHKGFYVPTEVLLNRKKGFDVRNYYKCYLTHSSIIDKCNSMKYSQG